jgi:hypothetical protein
LHFAQRFLIDEETFMIRSPSFQLALGILIVPCSRTQLNRASRFLPAKVSIILATALFVQA